MVATGESVQVLYVEESGRYRGDAAALRGVAGAAGAAARALPVAVVSVAGATRGGKSFLLDFCLRYLRATESAKRSGAWLGAEDEPLTGFSWRGGCDRNTEGILLWSEPFIISLGPENNNEKVAVLLMDTQGAFDSHSTTRDSATVFGLSALTASVQVFNVAQNIREDDLHYLQLFTEYGRVARAEGSDAPLQELCFLVRDWCCAFQHPYGERGGRDFLEKRLETRAAQADETRAVREQLRGAFERVRAFLMPHPGLTVAASPAFTGALRDISEDFKTALLELIPSLFAPEHLLIKHINGQRVTLQEFTEYFNSYVEIFNSDTLPTPTTVMQATSSASLEAALAACRNVYSAQMCAGGAACTPRAALPRRHAGALAAASEAFRARRTFAPADVATARLDALLQELDASLADYVAMNSGRILEAAARCKAGYEAAMQSDNCFTSEELTERHRTAVNCAKRAFYAEFSTQLPPRQENEVKERTEEGEDDDNSSNNTNEQYNNSINQEENIEELVIDNVEEIAEDDVDERTEDNEDWNILEKELEELLPLHRERNAARIVSALEAGRELYRERMRAAAAEAPCLHPRTLRRHHDLASRAARDLMLSAWHDATTVPQQYKNELQEGCGVEFVAFEEANDVNNKRVVEEVIAVYQNIMHDICYNADGLCLHPQDLGEQSERAERVTAEAFFERRDEATRHLPLDDYKYSVNKGTFRHFMKFCEENDKRNEAAVEIAHKYYMSNIAPVRVGVDVFSRHPLVKREAIEKFRSERRYYVPDVEDPHLKDLIKKIEDSYTWILLKVVAQCMANLVSVTALGALFMARR